jgi:hypothetical protein
VTYAVVDAHGNVVKRKIEAFDFAAGKSKTREDFEIYPRRAVAQSVADWMNDA